MRSFSVGNESDGQLQPDDAPHPYDAHRPDDARHPDDAPHPYDVDILIVGEALPASPRRTSFPGFDPNCGSR